jgi:hypothetical protein
MMMVAARLQVPPAAARTSCVLDQLELLAGVVVEAGAGVGRRRYLWRLRCLLSPLQGPRARLIGVGASTVVYGVRCTWKQE